MNALCVVQARVGSSRLPGKVLADLNGRPLLEFLLERLRPLPVDDLVVATSTRRDDDAVADLARELGFGVARGPEDDVLRRFAMVLSTRAADTVIRITADCPFTDPDLVAAVLARHAERGADFTTNVIPRTFPQGLDVEVATSDALRVADREAHDPREREHVMPFLYRHPERFRLANLRTHEMLGRERWVVDTAEDLTIAREIAASLPSPDAGWREILQIAGARAVPDRTPRLRPATEDDAEELLAWRNDPAAIQLSRTGLAVDPAGQRAWLRALLDDPGRRAWILEDADGPAGSVRIEVRDATATVSLAVDSRRQGRGLGTAALRLLTDTLESDPQVDRLSAEIHEANAASRRAFERAGYQPTGRDGAFLVLDHDLRAGPGG